MGRTIAILYVAVMVATIVGVDIAFFRGEFWARLMANAAIAVVFVAFYLLFVGRHWSPRQ
jgi:hypothetical protein